MIKCIEFNNIFIISYERIISFNIEKRKNILILFHNLYILK